MATERRVKLTATTQQTTAQGHRLVITASDANLMSEHLFVLRRTTLDPDTGQVSDVLYRVATPADLDTLPVDEPTDESGSLFRSDVLDAIYADEPTADAAWDGVYTDVMLLKEALDAADRLAAATFVWVGEPPP